MSWDGFDRQRRWTFPSASAAGLANPADYEDYGYDAAGRRTSLRKRDGVTIAYAYDGANRLISKSVPASASGAAGYGVFYGYDVMGLQLYARFGSASGPGVTNAYDGFGRLVSSTTTMDGVSRTLSSTYDSASNRIGLNGDSGYGTAFDYDPAGRMTAYREGGAASAVRIGYDAAGRRSSLGSGMGTATSAAAYGYDPLGRLASLTHDLAGTASESGPSSPFCLGGIRRCRSSLARRATILTPGQSTARGRARSGWMGSARPGRVQGPAEHRPPRE
jgi:YD repeat-containing protein